MGKGSPFKVQCSVFGSKHSAVKVQRSTFNNSALIILGLRAEGGKIRALNNDPENPL
jgi:hypothetical protein